MGQALLALAGVSLLLFGLVLNSELGRRYGRPQGSRSLVLHTGTNKTVVKKRP